MKHVIVFTQENYHDDDYGKLLPVELFDSESDAISYLYDHQFTQKKQSVYFKFGYHSELIARIYPVSS